ncbi:probable NAD(P)H dehydrogenase subunit CRR3, chloroplastic [Andrographis paniculata]|uniref:probable NAD(P)H dehydrogenase subunit CRR3, chloroplastic n=1 Tax=Andrographis paniculata TaxID=175694 RepID=UPI0021E7F38C|nr:probable NAD(P)H dehydrogenase subunit CRR3, chloroplastic [Andrographis paniculata]XP_051122373.1 probable NAD(P)H dehydrogenase subunit CRR3, chloroplastic [Andrographis paniculata]
MSILNCNSVIRHQISASSALPDDPSSPSVYSKPTEYPPPKRSRKLPLKLKLRQAKGAQQPTVLEIERAIGAGIFRDRDVNSESGDKSSLFERNTVGEDEGSVKKKLSDVSEWLIDQTERTSRRAGKPILVSMFVWMIPIWMVGFAVASGIIQLPFQTPFLEDLIS